MKSSLLDRLLDDHPEIKGEPVLARDLSYGQMRAVIERDLENLLNTRCFAEPFPESGCEVNKSLQMYGLPDFTARNPTLPSVRAELREAIERAVEQFEPRLRNVTVRVENPTTGERRLHFKINAFLQTGGADEPVSFETFFDSNRGEYIISRQR